MKLRLGPQQLTLDVVADGARQRVTVDGREHVVDVRSLDDETLLLDVDGIQHRVHLARRGRERFVAVAGEVYHFVPESSDGGHQLTAVLESEIRAPMPGKVLQVLTAAGSKVEAGDGLLIVEAMKMENRLEAPAAGVVEEVRVEAGQTVDGGQVLLVLRYD